MNWTVVGVATASLTAFLGAAELKYSQDFSMAAVGDPPEDFMVLDGQFTVREESGNKFLELPGAPLETFGVLFGPSNAAGVRAQARIWGTKAGRKQPVFALGLNGQSGFKLRISPAKQAIELLKGEEVIVAKPFQWKSGEWTTLDLQIRAKGSGIVVEGKAWQGGLEPSEWSLQIEQPNAPPPGKAGVWGLPFSGTPLRFDDFKLAPAT